MSCILFSKESYTALGKNPTFRDVCKRGSMDPEVTAVSLWLCNKAAFLTRYEGRHSEDIEAAEKDRELDYEFLEAFEATGLMKYVALSRLLGRIDYQCSDINETDSREMSLYRVVEKVDYLILRECRDQFEHMLNVRTQWIGGDCNVSG